MALTTGTRLGVYEITSLLGEGGMGQVYRATDTRLKRQVAVKILPPALAADGDRLSRFQREAEVLASLNHPNIAAVYGLEESSETSALVMELVEGEDLSQRIARGPIAIADALVIGRQITEALEAAHDRGIIHRDLKPANIKLRADGAVKVLDFGLAKALEPAALPGESTMVAAITSPVMTQPGMILGTAAYMSPEQARGTAVDKRADIWGFGCVFYEMLTGARAFPGNHVSEVLASVLAREPDWSRVPADVSPAVVAYVKRCLQKEPKQRVHDIADVRLALDGAFEGASTTVPPRRSRVWSVGAAAFAAGATAAVVFTLLRTSSAPTPRMSRLEVASSGDTQLALIDAQRHIAITPDGSRVVYTAIGGNALLVRRLDALEPTPVFQGTNRGLFISPDSAWIGFGSGGQLKKVPVDGGPVETIVVMDAPTSRGATWGQDGSVVFATTNGTTGLQHVKANGEGLVVLTRPDRENGEADHVWPEWLPDGKHVLFTIAAASGGLDAFKVAVLDVATPTRTVLFAGSHAIYVPIAGARASGHLLFMTAGTLWAVPFDLERLETRGSPVVVLRNVVTTTSGSIDAVMSADGTLAYVSGLPLAEPARTLAWVDTKGVETPIPAEPRAYVHPRLSRDGRRLAVYTSDQELDIWLSDLIRPTLTRVTSGAGVEGYPLWTPDERRLIFSSQSESVGNLYWQRADGSAGPERLTDSPNLQLPTAVAPNGAVLVFMEVSGKGDFDLMQMTLDGARKISRLVQTAFSERNGVISPDGRWLAYEADDSGPFEIYVTPYPDVGGGRTRISSGGGVRPLWSRGGKELLYVNPSGAIIAVAVSAGAPLVDSPPVLRVRDGYFTSPGNFGRNVRRVGGR